MSIRFFRGIDSHADDGEQSPPVEQVKIEFESIQSLISERTTGGAKVKLEDFCKFV